MMEGMHLPSLALIAVLAVAPMTQSPIVTESGIEPLIESGWIVSVNDDLYVDGSVVAPVAASLDTYTTETPGYDRTGDFGAAWKTKIDGCDTRNRILQRDFVTFETQADGCTVVTGVFDDPYSGETMDFQRTNYPNKGDGDSGAIQIDHIVPLKAGWDGGASKWTQELREQFANDPMNLWASEGRLNGSKGEKLMGQWQPPNAAFQCEYAAKMVWVLDTYDVAVLPADQDHLVSTLEGCTLPVANGEAVITDEDTAADPVAPDATDAPATAEQTPAMFTPLTVGIGIALVIALVWVIVVLARRR